MAGIITQAHDSNGLPVYEDSTGTIRYLGKLMPDQEVRKNMAQSSDLFAPVPRSQWITVSRRNSMGTDFVLHQRQHNSCVGFSAAQAMMRQRYLRGYGFVRLSGAYIYSWINHGRDAGSVITDALAELSVHGTCLEDTVNSESIYRDQAAVGDTEAKRFRLQRGLAIRGSDQGSAFDWLATAILKGFIPQFAIEVGNNFDFFDGNGVAGFSPGGGNHSVHADGLVNINGKWFLDMPNTWGPEWGDHGRCLLSESHIQTVVDFGGEDAFIHEDETLDPDDPDNPSPPA